MCTIIAWRHCVMDPDYCHRMADLLEAEVSVHPPESKGEKRRESDRAHTFRFYACKLLREPPEARCAVSFFTRHFFSNGPRRLCKRHRELCHEIAGWFVPATDWPGMRLVVAEARARALIAESTCRFGDPLECVSQGLRYVAGDGVEADAELGRAFLEEACNTGEAWGCSALADNYCEAESLEERALAVNFYKRGCEGGNGAACWKLGRMYLKGDRVDQSPDRASALFQRACALGHQAGCAYGKKLAK